MLKKSKFLAVFPAFLMLTSCLQDPNIHPSTPANPKIDAMKKVAQQDPACKALGNFYWSVGDQSGRLGQGQIGSQWNENTAMAIFSASKMIFSTYVLEKTAGNLTDSLIKGLNFTSGYTGPNENVCLPSDTVGSCFTRDQSRFEPAKVGTFVYASGHMQKIASVDLGLAPLTRATLANEMMSVLGSDINFIFEVNELGIQAGPVLAGGIKLAPTTYEKLLTKIVNGTYQIKNFLGSNAVPTGINGVQYSLGHWVEQDGAFSSVGALGFLPWVDSTKTYWGVIARVERDLSKVATASVSSQVCGQKMRAAFMSASN